MWTTGQDPWQHYASPSKVEPTSAIRAFETEIEKSVLSKLPPPNQEHESRLTSLESQVQTLMSQQVQLEHHMRDSDTQHAKQFQHMQSQINHQGQQIHGAIQSQEQNIQAMFTTQMAEIRSLLSKRPRGDQAGGDAGME